MRRDPGFRTAAEHHGCTRSTRSVDADAAQRDTYEATLKCNLELSIRTLALCRRSAGRRLRRPSAAVGWAGSPPERMEAGRHRSGSPTGEAVDKYLGIYGQALIYFQSHKESEG